MSFSFFKPDQVEVEVELEEWDSILEKNVDGRRVAADVGILRYFIPQTLNVYLKNVCSTRMFY